MSGSSEPSATIAIDFGTSAIRAAVVTSGSSWLVPEPVTGATSWPAVAHWDGTQLRVGSLAGQARNADPDGYWSELKRVLTVDASVCQGGRALRPIELVTEVLRAVVAQAQRRHGAAIDRALLTVPASYRPGGRHRARMVAAAEAAGLGTVELVAEPVAAACAAGLGAGTTLLVCDLGAGSFDVALVRLVRLAAEPVILAADSLEGAGRELDSLVERRIYADGQSWLRPLLADASQEPGGRSAVRLGMALTDLAQRLKHRLSEAPVAQDAMLPHTPPYQLTRDELASVAAPLLGRLLTCCQRLLPQPGALPSGVDAVLLTGGGARLPLVAQWAARSLGQVPYLLPEPELSVVHGAVRWLASHGRATVAPEQLAPGTAPLAFAIPGGRAQLVRWLVVPGQRYDAGMVLARVRLPAGGLWELTAATPGTLDRVLVAPDTEITAHQWLALTTP